jgi:hypothetical protein
MCISQRLLRHRLLRHSDNCGSCARDFCDDSAANSNAVPESLRTFLQGLARNPRLLILPALSFNSHRVITTLGQGGGCARDFLKEWLMLNHPGINITTSHPSVTAVALIRIESDVPFSGKLDERACSRGLSRAGHRSEA